MEEILFEGEKIRALSWKQPFGSLMLHGKIETRTWNTNVRGNILICNSLQPYSTKETIQICGQHQYNRIVALISGKTKPNYGYAIAVGTLVDSRPMTKQDEDKCFVEYWEGLWCHVYENVRPIEPFKFKGGQGFRKLDQQTINKIKFI